MTAQEAVRRYAMLGVVNYVEQEIKKHTAQFGAPKLALIGQLEWKVIMEAEPDDDWSVAGVKVIPNDDAEWGVELL